jgi:hypothetical protein
MAKGVVVLKSRLGHGQALPLGKGAANGDGGWGRVCSGSPAVGDGVGQEGR